MKRKQILASGLFDYISAGFNWWDVFLKISVATVFTRCIKSLNWLDFSEVMLVHRTFDVSKCGVITGIHCHLLNSFVLPGLKKLPRTLMMCLLHRIGHGDPLLEVTGVQLSRSSGSTGSLLPLPSSFSGSFSDSAELDSSSDSSLFPNRSLFGFGERSKEESLLVAQLSNLCTLPHSNNYMPMYYLFMRSTYKGRILNPV